MGVFICGKCYKNHNRIKECVVKSMSLATECKCQSHLCLLGRGFNKGGRITSSVGLFNEIVASEGSVPCQSLVPCVNLLYDRYLMLLSYSPSNKNIRDTNGSKYIRQNGE